MQNIDYQAIRGGVNLRSKLLHILYPRQGQWALSWIFFVPAGVQTPPGPLSEGEARSGKELGERLGREPAAGRFPPLRGGARQGGGVKKQLGNY